MEEQSHKFSILK